MVNSTHREVVQGFGGFWIYHTTSLSLRDAYALARDHDAWCTGYRGDA